MFVRFIRIVMCSFGSCIFIAGLYAIVQYTCATVDLQRSLWMELCYWKMFTITTFSYEHFGYVFLAKCAWEKNLPGHRIYASSISLNEVNFFFLNGCANLPSKQQWMSLLCSTSFPTLGRLRLIILANWWFWKAIVLFAFSFPWLLMRLNAFAYIYCSLFPHL